MKQRFRLITLLIVPVLLIATPLLCSTLLLSLNRNLAASLYFTAFQDVEPETPLLGTDTRIEYTNQNMILKNTVTQATTMVIQNYSPIALPPNYQLLHSDNHIYVIIRLASGGNSSASWFKVFDVSVSPPKDLIAQYNDPNMGHSCTNPVLVGESLKFEIALDCQSASLDTSAGFQTYWLYLDGLSR